MVSCVIGVDVGGTNIRLGAVTEDGTLLHKSHSSSDVVKGEGAGERLVQLIKEYSENISGMDICAVSIGFPSTLNRERTVVLSTPNVEGLNQVAFGERYKKVLGLPVFGEKDSCMLIYYDMLSYSFLKQGVSIGIYVGTGLGNVILLDGNPLAGKNGAAGELSHIPVLHHKDKCGCGLEGCLELYAGGRGLETIASTFYPGEFIGDIFKDHAEEDPVLEYLKGLAKAIAIEATLLDPDYICLGGGVLSMEAFPRTQLLDMIRTYTRHPMPSGNMEIVFSEQGIYNGVIGAGLYGWHRLKSK